MQALATLDGSAVPQITIEQAADYLSNPSRFDLGQARDALFRARGHLEGAGFVAGVCLCAVKEYAPHGEFQRTLEALQIPERTARRYMSRARAILDWHQQFESKRPTLAVLGSGQVDLLLRLPKARRLQLLSAPGDDLAGFGPEAIRETTIDAFGARVGVADKRARAPRKSKAKTAEDLLDVWNLCPANERRAFLAVLAVDDDVPPLGYRVESAT